jgi:DNA-directed RNA polymerase specialized sigma24 family protein
MSGHRNVVSIRAAKAPGASTRRGPGLVIPDREAQLSKRISDTLSMLSKTRDRFARLPESDRAALTAVVIDGLSYRDAADRLNVSVDGLMAHLSSARETLRTMIARDH